jgi:hypothetical protein
MLNTQKYSGLELTKENILKITSQEEIFMYYINELPLDRSILSPIRFDSNPNFRLFYTYTGDLWYNDFGYTKGDCFTFVMNKFGISFFDALKKINEDLKLDLYGNCNINSHSAIHKKEIKIIQKPEIILQADIRKYNEKEQVYWRERGVIDRIYVANAVYFNKQVIWYYKSDNPIFVYYFPKTNHIKAYRPLEQNKKLKWISNCNIYDVFGWEEFIEYKSVDNLIITKSGKDRLILKNLGYISIAPQAEGNSFPQEYIDIIKEKTKNIWINMDNDEAGYKATHKYCQMFDTDLVFNTHKKDPDESYLDNKERLINDLKMIK